MRTVLIINDNSPEAKHAIEFTLVIAQKMHAHIMLLNTFGMTSKTIKKVPAGNISTTDLMEYPVSGLHSLRLHSLLNVPDKEQTTFNPEIEELDISNMKENEVIQLINRNHIWMMVKGMGDVTSAASSKRSLNIHTVLNGVLCPLLLVPTQWQLKNIERLVYITDLRYCHLPIVRYLAELAGLSRAVLSIAHRSARGLPDMAEDYALTLFREGVSNNVRYDLLFFYHVKEKDPAKVIDVMINGIHNDILVLVNRRCHFEEIVGRYITETLPSHITIPLFIFPC